MATSTSRRQPSAASQLGNPTLYLVDGPAADHGDAARDGSNSSTTPARSGESPSSNGSYNAPSGSTLNGSARQSQPGQQKDAGEKAAAASQQQKGNQAPKKEEHRSWGELHEDYKLNDDLRSKLPLILSRFLGWKDPSVPKGESQPPLPFPPFSWLKHIPLKYEIWLLSTIASFVAIALVEVILSAAFPNDGTILIVASFGASAVLTYANIESPLAQPRHLFGGQVFSVILAVAITKLFRLSPHYQLSQTIVPYELSHIVWLNGALAMALSLLLMQITGTVHPPGGATAIIASTTPSAIAMSWRLIYIVIITSVVFLAWAQIINNVGRRRYPTYWLSSTNTFVRSKKEKEDRAKKMDPEKVAEDAEEQHRHPSQMTQEEKARRYDAIVNATGT